MNKVSKQFHTLRILFSVLSLSLLISVLLVESISAETRYRVRSSDNLNSIIDRFYKDSELTKAQLMAGILATNPRAFIKGNINFLLKGKRLTLPDELDIQQISPEIARELLSPTAKTIAPDKSDITNDAGSKKLLARQKLQTEKINLLQQESDALKKQLEALVDVKADRDQRLLELETSLKKAISSGKTKSTFSAAAQNNETTSTRKLQDANERLQQSLQETKSELAENANSNIALERKVENLKDALKDKDAKKALPNTVEDNDGGTSILEKVSSIGSNLNLQEKLIWLIPLLLLAALLYFLLRKKKAKNRDNALGASQNYQESYQETYLESNENIDTDFEEDSLETSIKLDVARAYIEAEDTQSALDILTEIMEEGSDEQRIQAQELLESIA